MAVGLGILLKLHDISSHELAGVVGLKDELLDFFGIVQLPVVGKHLSMVMAGAKYERCVACEWTGSARSRPT